MKRHSHILSLLLLLLCSATMHAQFNTERVLVMGRSALYYEDYVLSIQRFNTVINARPNMAEPYFYRGLAKFYLEDYAGAEQDCSKAVSLNPYAFNYYELRGLCRIHQENYAMAEQDYVSALKIKETDESCWHNMVLCQLNQEAFDRADSCLDLMIKQWPRVAENYCIKAQVQMARKDSVAAEKWVDRTLAINPYESTALSMKAMFLLLRNEYAAGEEVLTRAISQKSRQADLYLNRALARYNQENLRGAMDDYDAALEINDKSFVGHFNRGLLRAQVGDNNRAIEDFNFVIEREPDNYMAIYNRAVLYKNVGQYRAAMRDLTTIINVYPQFWDGYLLRAELRRKLGDVAGAERDEFVVMKARIEGFKKIKTKKTRKKDDEDMENYELLVENDEQETDKEYTSEWRGRVQNRPVDLQPKPTLTADASLLNAMPGAGKLLLEADSVAIEKASLEAKTPAAQHVVAIAYYNMGTQALQNYNYPAALHAFDKAIALDSVFPEAFYNRGIAHILLGENETGLADLSHAGELGIYSAYSLIKHYSGGKEKKK